MKGAVVRWLLAGLFVSNPTLAMNPPKTVVVRQSRCYEKYGVTAGGPGDVFPFGDKTKAGDSAFLQVSSESRVEHRVRSRSAEGLSASDAQEQAHGLRASTVQWPDPTTTQCPLVYDAISCAMVGAHKSMFAPPTFSIVDDKTADERVLYKNTKNWLLGAGKGYQPTPSACAWCESPGSGHGVCVKCNSFDINGLEQQGYTCAPHCAASLSATPPRWEPQKVNPFFPIPPPQHEQAKVFGTREWCQVLVDKTKATDPSGSTFVTVSTSEQSASDHFSTFCNQIFQRFDGAFEVDEHVCSDECRAVAAIYDTLQQMEAAPTRFNFQNLFEAVTETGKVHYVLTVEDCVQCVDTRECFPKAFRAPSETDVQNQANYFRLLKTTTASP